MKRKAHARVVPQLEFLEPREAPSASPWLLETFNSISLGSLPGGWSQWSSSGTGAFGVISTTTANGTRDLAVSASTSGLTARAWVNSLVPADAQVSAMVYLNSLIPAEVFLRGTGLNTAVPNFYAVSVTRGLQVPFGGRLTCCSGSEPSVSM